MKTKIIEVSLVVVLSFAIATSAWLVTRSYKAEKFCQDNGHDTGRYKARAGGYYNCADFTKYRIEDVKN